MSIMLTTDGVSEWASGIHPRDEFLVTAHKKGRRVLGFAGIPSKSDDLAVLAYLCHRDLSKAAHEGRLDEDYLVAGNVLDSYVTDHDAELLVELEPEVRRRLGGEIGGMTAEVSAVHLLLLDVVGALREKWEGDDNDGEEGGYAAR